MKKQFLLMVLLIVGTALSAQVFTEYFETAPTGGNLEGYNDWYVSFKSSEANGVSPKIAEDILFYDNYAGSDIGKTVFLDSLIGKESATQRITTKLVNLGEGGDTLKSIPGQKMYAAFLVQILPNSYTSFRDFFTWEASTTSSFTRGRVFAKVSNEKNDVQFAVSKNSASSGVYVESGVYEGGVGAIFLLVLEYNAIEGDGNDVVSLYINPDPTKAASEQATVLVSQDEQSDYGSQDIKINLRQRGVGALVGGIRVGTSWNEVLQGSSTDIDNIAKTDEVKISAFNKTIVTASHGDVEIFDISGRKIMSARTSGRLNTSLKGGTYIVRFTDENNKVFSGKVSIY